MWCFYIWAYFWTQVILQLVWILWKAKYKLITVSDCSKYGLQCLKIITCFYSAVLYIPTITNYKCVLKYTIVTSMLFYFPQKNPPNNVLFVKDHYLHLKSSSNLGEWSLLLFRIFQPSCELVIWKKRIVWWNRFVK